MEGGRRRGTTKNGAVEGSVWESRMKSDEVKGGIKVFNAEEKKPEENGGKRLRPRQSQIGANGKRTTTGKSDISDGFEQNPIQISRQRSEPRKELDQQWKELSVSPDGTKKKSPVQKIKKTRSEVGKGISASVDGIERQPTRNRKAKPESLRLICQSDGEIGNGDEIERNSIGKMKTRSGEIKEVSVSVDGSESNPVQIRRLNSESLELICQSEAEPGNGDGTETNVNKLRKVKSESNRDVGESVNGRNSIPLSKVKSMPIEVLDDGNGRSSTELKVAKSDANKGVDESVEEIEKSPVGNEKSGGDELCKEFGVCEEKVVSSGLSNLGLVKSAPEMEVDVEEEEDEEEEEEEADDPDDDDEDWDEESDEEVDEEIEIDDEEGKEVEVKKIDIIKEEKPKKVVNEEKKVQEVQEKTPPNSSTVKKQVPSVVNHSRVPPTPAKTKSSFVAPAANGFQRTPEANAGFQRAPETNAGFQRAPQTHNKLQSLVDLVMWRDVSKSAFIFGLGTFITVSLSYTKDLNISFITVISYLGLVYLAAIFLFRSIILRGVIDGDYTSPDYVVGEEEAMWLLKMVLPYLNEFLLKLRALFSGDPATTMKLAVLLFVLARCGSSITIWKMAKLGFFGVFTVPRICSSYSTQLSNYGKFWVRRFKDAWETCAHKKAVAFGIFTLVWNLSSVMARIWAVFMLYVAFRYYQQSLPTDNWVEEEPKCETTWQDPIGERRRGRRTATVDVRKEKKRF